MSTVADCAFQLKADLFPLTVFCVHDPRLERIKAQLTDTIQKAPKYFEDAPFIIDVSRVAGEDIDFAGLAAVLKEANTKPFGIRGVSDDQKEAAAAAGLALFKQTPSAQTESAQASPKAQNIAKAPTRIITKPVRAGTKIYAKNADLIIIAPVNVGAECIADGSIHVYGPLRGRALAGASGDKNARIFCQSLDAELIAIAGHYQVSEHLQVPEHNGHVLQVFLQDNKLNITSI